MMLRLRRASPGLILRSGGLGELRDHSPVGVAGVAAAAFEATGNTGLRVRFA